MDESVRIDHVACAYRSRDAAQSVLGQCFGLRMLRAFTLPEESATALLGLDHAVEVLVYGAERRIVEAFVLPGSVSAPGVSHVCLVVGEMEATLARCRAAGLEVRSAWVGDHDVFFVADLDGNLFEMKQA